MSIWYAYNNLSKAGMVKPYAGECAPYYDLKGTQWFDKLTESIPAIQKKTLEVLAQSAGDMQAYYNTALVDEGKWESKAFLVWNIPKGLRERKSNELFDFFRHIPGLVSLSVSVLKPGTHIKPHNGDTDAVYRMHIPVSIPAGLPLCGIKVNGIERPWPENEITVFCDAHLHEAWNHSEKTRIILIVDVVRPELLRQTRGVCTRVLSWLFLQRVIQIKLPRAMSAIIALILLVGAVPLFMLLQRRAVVK